MIGSYPSKWNRHSTGWHRKRWQILHVTVVRAVWTCPWFTMVNRCSFPYLIMDAVSIQTQNLMAWAYAPSANGSVVFMAQYRSRARPGMEQGCWSRYQPKAEPRQKAAGSSKEATMANNHHNRT